MKRIVRAIVPLSLSKSPALLLGVTFQTFFVNTRKAALIALFILQMTYEHEPYIGLTQCLNCQSENINSISMLKINFPESRVIQVVKQ